MGQAIGIVKKRIIEYSPMMKITYNELNEIIGHVGKIMYAIHKIPFVWTNFESDEGIELNKEPLNLLELGENKDIIMKLQGNDFTEEEFRTLRIFLENIYGKEWLEPKNKNKKLFFMNSFKLEKITIIYFKKNMFFSVKLH